MRKLFPHEAPQLCEHLGRLTTDERGLRFMAAVSDASLRQHCEQLDWRRTVVLGLFGAGVLRGAAEVQLVSGQVPLRCELAVTVEAPWQDRGAATELMRRALVIARNRSARAVQLNCMEDNHRMQRVAGKFGAKFHYSAAEQDAEAEIVLAAPTHLSLLEEWIDDGFGWIHAGLGEWSRRAASAAGRPLAT